MRDKEKQKKARAKYRKSAKGKIAYKKAKVKYQKSPKGKATTKKANAKWYFENYRLKLGDTLREGKARCFAAHYRNKNLSSINSCHPCKTIAFCRQLQSIFDESPILKKAGR
ncbi:unnamed protein product [marine sediment metagenome]|uniref:Uncharacterized protein n=1 Tax=marine sediment metagenome TaxID=412755 RepID=X1RVG3_9ZZZZ